MLFSHLSLKGNFLIILSLLFLDWTRLLSMYICICTCIYAHTYVHVCIDVYILMQYTRTHCNLPFYKLRMMTTCTLLDFWHYQENLCTLESLLCTLERS